jgi:antitoxin component YwqK of YwqJK toxin-antitoxin module
MKKLLTKLIILSCLISCTPSIHAQQVVKKYYDWAKTKLKEVYTINASGQLNGVAKVYTEDGMLSEERTYKNNQLNGVFKKYNVRSELSNTPEAKRVYEMTNYLNGDKHGIESTYDFYYNGKTFDEWQRIARGTNNGWGDNESVKNVSDCLKKGKQIKLSDTYYKEGVKQREVTFFPSGKTEIDIQFGGGKKIKQINYYESGKVAQQSSFLDGKEDKIVSTFENGKMQYEYYFNGPYKSFYENGKPEYIFQRKNGEIDGKIELFSDDGTKLAEGFYKEGKAAGKFNIQYCETGNIAHPLNGKAIFKRELTLHGDGTPVNSAAYYLTGEKLDETSVARLSSLWQSILPDGSAYAYVSFYKNGNKKQEGFLKGETVLIYTMKNGELELDTNELKYRLVGTWKYYDPNGNARTINE